MRHEHRAYGFRFGFQTLSINPFPPYGWYLYIEIYYGRCARRQALWTHYFKKSLI